MKQQKIEALTGKLLDCGYHAEQIRHIVSEALESAAAGDSQENVIIEALEEYLAFGVKCRMTGK